ncbi:hypothetical protein HETIRDRAFT_331807 [Heterobasidion irregulare TC 32-1]|uniref:Uncharacterized protein n=1 Tax=Heterobasidion irregulare (strain TC 32-1) TaxID=747525 RepID=W4JN14_HETIT|nr:uncharacterized protein HETIRDRAFT_331807 [Heterobasidion irregulare TC 32-1]ETW74859.1 hypothetical protein HETIRDRAFT_331807 [Heterobasidion irregulare TC 32-1]
MALRAHGMVWSATQSPRLGARTPRSENRFSFQFVSRCARDAIWLRVLYLSAVYERKGCGTESSLRQGMARLRTHRRERAHIYECACACVHA